MRINIDITDKHFVLIGDVKELLSERRASVSLKRLGAKETEVPELLIPFEEKTKIFTLKSIDDLLSKFDAQVELGESTVAEVSAYSKEQENFQSFSDKARKIRNDDFISDSELVSDFKNFKSVLEQKMERTLFPLQLLSAFHMAFSQHSCNFAVPGAGKTSIVYGAYAFLKNLDNNNPRHVDKLIVIGPLSSFAPWENEYKACFGVEIESQRMSGDLGISRSHKVQHLYSANPKELTLVSHAGISLMEKEIVDFLRQNKTMVIVDEAHRIKNAEGVWGQSVVEIAKEATSRVILTGTPVPNFV